MARIKKAGMHQGDLIDALDRLTGRIWIPVSQFNDIGAAELGAVGSSKPVGLAFDATTAEEADVSILVPKDFDETQAASIYVYWSSADTNGNDVVWDIDYLARAAGEDVGASVSNLTTTDTDSTTADALNISDALTLPASTVADGDILYLNLRREAADAGDDLAADATFYGIRIDYTPKPEIVT